MPWQLGPTATDFKPCSGRAQATPAGVAAALPDPNSLTNGLE